MSPVGIEKDFPVKSSCVFFDTIVIMIILHFFVVPPQRYLIYEILNRIFMQALLNCKGNFK